MFQSSVPWDESTLNLKDVNLGDQSLGVYSTLVGNISNQVVDQEWLGEVILVVRVWHSLEVDSHGGSGFDITDFIHTVGRIAVSVEETCQSNVVVSELIVHTLIPLLVEVDNVVGSWGEQTTELLVLEDVIKDQDLINGWLSTFISNSSPGSETEESEMDFPEKGLGHHEEAEGGIAEEASGPSVIGSVKSATNLPEVVTQADGPLMTIVSEDITAVGEVIWVAVSLLWLNTAGTSEESLVVIIVVAITSVRWFKSFIVPSWVEGSSSTGWTWSDSEAPHWCSNNHILGGQCSPDNCSLCQHF